MQISPQDSNRDDCLLLYAMTLWHSKNGNTGTFLFWLTTLLQSGGLTVEDLQNLLVVLPQGGIVKTATPHGVYLWKADFEDKLEIVGESSVSLPVVCGKRSYQLQRQDVIADFQRIHQNYQEAKAQGISIHKGLVQFFESKWKGLDFGYDYLKQKSVARQTVLEVLARSQEVVDGQVQRCWPMIIDYGIRSTGINPATLEEWITYFQYCIDKSGGGGMGDNDLMVELMNHQIEVSCYGNPTIYCKPQVFVDELKTLLHRYQNSMM